MTTNTLEKYQFKIQMDKWLTQFNTYDEYENFLDSQDCPRLNVSYVVDDDQTYYFKDNTSTNFFTMKFTTDWHSGTYIELLGRKSQIWGQDNLHEAEYAKIRVKKNGATEFGAWEPYNGGSFDTGDTIQLSIKYKDEYLNTENTYAAYIKSQWDGNEHRAEVSGNIMSMIYGDDFLLYDSKDKFKFWGEWNYTVSNADNLSMPRIITQKDSCDNMFSNTPITSLPKLPAKTVPEGCYQWIFGGCQNLTDLSSYKLDAKYVTGNSLVGMFSECSNLNLPPQFNTLTFSGGAPIPYLFYNCTSLQRIPNIDLVYDGTDWGANFENIYAGCTSLTDESSRYIRIDQKNGKYNCYMQKEFNLVRCFQNCSSMTKSPKLINFRLNEGCFDGCTSLTEIYYANPMNPVTDVGLFSDMPQTGTLFYPYFSQYTAEQFSEPWRNQWTLQKMWFDELDNFMMWNSTMNGDNYDPYFTDMYWARASVWRDDRTQEVFADEGPGANWTQYDFFNTTIFRLDWSSDKINKTFEFGGWTATGDQVKGYNVYKANNQWDGNDVYAVYNPETNWPEFFSHAFDSYQTFIMEFATKPSWLS